MTNEKIDFKSLATSLVSHARQLVPDWLPGGKLVGKEWCCANLTGVKGNSLKVNLNTGVWSDFADNGNGGSDLISLYAAIFKKSQFESAKDLMDKVQFNPSNAPVPVQEKTLKPAIPPDNSKPNTKHYKLGDPSYSWLYMDKSGNRLFYITRYESSEGKQILPWSYVNGAWKNKHWPVPRPMYGLENLNGSKKPILLVEGEKACVAARKLLGQYYNVMTWPGGSNSIDKTDWSPIYGRIVLIWPDADKPGIAAANKIASKLIENGCQVKILQTDKSGGWDAADALEEGWSTDAVIKWAKPLAKSMNKKIEEDKNQPQAVNLNIQFEDMPVISESAYALHEKLGVPMTKNGSPICNIDTCTIMLMGIPSFKDMFWYDSFHMKYYTRMPIPRSYGGFENDVREFSTVDNVYLLKFFQGRLGLPRMSEDILYKAVLLFGKMNERNEAQAFFRQAKWDGIPRINKFFQDCLGVKDNEYVQAVGANFWISMIARVMRPGCKSDYMVVLEGAQGVGKSEAFKAIGGEWYTEAGNNLDSKDFYQILQGNIIAEIAELDSFNKAEVTRIKQVITCASDRYRAPYDRTARNYPRQSVFVGTTNESHWQRDYTGGRRFWPLTCGKVNLDKIREIREQCFAEALVRYKSGADWYKTPIDRTKSEQEKRRQVDEWEDRIEDYLFRPGSPGHCTLLEVAENALKFDANRVDMRIQKRIASALYVLGWDKATVAIDGKQKRVWKPKIGGKNDLFVEDVPDYGIEGSEANLQEASTE